MQLVEAELSRRIRGAGNTFVHTVAYAKTDGVIWIPNNSHNPHRKAILAELAKLNIPFYPQDQRQEEIKETAEHATKKPYSTKTIEKLTLLLEKILLGREKFKSTLQTESQEVDAQDIWHPRTDFPE